MLRRTLLWAGGTLLGLIVLLMLLMAFASWNWLKGPIEHRVTQSTGRELSIGGDLDLKFAWPLRVRAEKVTFANPDWATEKHMFSVDAAEASISLWGLLTRRFYFPEVVLTHPAVFLEQSKDGRKSWLLDREQKDEGRGAAIGRLVLDQGVVGYDDAGRKTHLRSDVSTGQDGEESRIAFDAKGTYKGHAVQARGTGGSVLALRDESTPYPLDVEGTMGKTALKVQGTVTGLTTFAAADLKIDARGESLDQLFPLIGIALPATHKYSTHGRLVHKSDDWRYEQFVAKVGESDLQGSISVDTSGKRPVLHGDLVAKLLDFDDLGPIIGTSSGGTPPKKPKDDRVLPEIPFNTARWDTLDADVKLKATAIRKAAKLPIDDFSAHLVLKDRKLSLDPLNFGIAGGRFASSVALDGQKKPIAAQARLNVEQVQLARLMPTVDLNNKASVGRIDGIVEMKGNGDSVAKMLGTANGKAGLVIAGGQISNLMMEIVGIDLWEMLKFKVNGDQPVSIRCGVLDAGAQDGVLTTNILVLDTDDTKVTGSGTLSLKDERLDLKLEPQPKDKSLVSLRTPIHVRGVLAKPEIGPEKRRLAIKGLGALALGAVNPLLAVLPLVETGPGLDSDCGRLIREAKASQKKRVAQPAR